MPKPPSLSYPSLSTPRPRRLTPAIALLIVTASLYTIAALVFCLGIATNPSQTLFDYILLTFVAVSLVIFAVAAFHIRRHRRRWAWLALITSLINLTTLLSFTGFARFSSSFVDDPGVITTLTFLAILFAPLHIALSLLLFFHLRKPKPT